MFLEGYLLWFIYLRKCFLGNPDLIRVIAVYNAEIKLINRTGILLTPKVCIFM